MQEVAYAAQDRRFGWFVQAAAESFAYLTELGFDRPQAYLHFRGTFVTFRTDRCSVDAELDPDSRNLEVSIAASTSSGEILRRSIWEVLAEREPETDWFPPPRQRGLGDQEVVALLWLWSNGLRRVAPDVLEPCLAGRGGR